MKTIINNINNLQENEMTDLVRKVKILLTNSKGEIMLGYADHEYQFPGGTAEADEDLIDTVNREIEEETGIVLNVKDVEPFLCAIGYYKDWPKEGRNKKISIYYYEVKTDELPNLNNLNLTENEIAKNFELRYVSLDRVEEEITSNVDTYGDPHGIAKEMLQAFSVYKNN